MTGSGENEDARSSNRGDDATRRDESVSGSVIDPERLAALIDGRLGPREREAVLAQIAASSDETVEVFADALAVTRELEASSSAEGLEALSPAVVRTWRGMRWRTPGGLAAIAAALVAVVVVPTWLSTLDSEAAHDPGRFVRALAEVDRGLPVDWDTQPWGATRGAADALSPEARALRVGARMVDLELTARTGDPRTAELAASVVALLEGIPGAAPAATEYRTLASADSAASPEQLTRLAERARRTAAPFVDRDYLKFGAWLEAARVAAAARDTGFFGSRASREAVEEARKLRGLSAPERAAVNSLHATSGLSTRRRGTDWDALGRTLTRMLGTLGR